MKNVLLVADVSNLYITTRKKHGDDAKVSFVSLMEYAKELGHVNEGLAFGSIVSNSYKPFGDFLRNHGYKVCFKQAKKVGGVHRKAGYVADLVVKVMSRQFDILVLATSDADYAPLVEHFVEAGKSVVVIGSGVSAALKQVATESVEIPQSFLHKDQDSGTAQNATGG